MNTELREMFRGVAHRSRAKAHLARLEELKHDTYLCLEWKPVRGGPPGLIPCGTLLSLSLGESGALVLRDDHERHPGWQGAIDCHPEVVRRHLRRLGRLGLWELNDFTPTVVLLDGENFIVQARDPSVWPFLRETDACLSSPGAAVSPYLRKMARYFEKLLAMKKETFLAQSWRCEYYLGWWNALFPWS